MDSAPAGPATVSDLRGAPALDERVCLALYRASRATTSFYRPLLAPLGLTYPQYLVLTLLWQEGTRTVGEIGRRLDLDSSTLSPLLKRLEAAGLLSRRRSDRDERAVEVVLTPAGVALEARADDVPQAVCDATGLAPDAQSRLVDQLLELAAAVERATTQQPSG